MSVQSRLGTSAADGSCMACAVPDPTRSQDVIVFHVGSFTMRLCPPHTAALVDGLARNIATADRRRG